ncbi:MAG: hypothetical protein II393_02360 [Cytophagales bacterium]|nr:hypothetical protein [Cytophagales bacterium]
MADFNFHLNRQGPVGKKGEKGEKGKDGNTPIFSEGTNTATEYTLLIDYGDGNIGQTGNLRPPVTNEGGTYVRYNTQTGTYEINEADIADLNRTQGEVTLASVQDVIDETALDTDAVSFELRNQDLEDINEDIEALDEKVDGIDDRLDTAEGTLERAQDDISQAQQDIVSLDNRVENLDDRVTTNEGAITTLQTGKANVVHTHTISQITDAGALASQNVVDYQSQVINKPTIPIVGDGTITITQGGVTKGTFTTNQSGDSTINLDAGGGGGTYTEGAGITIDQNNEISVNVDNDTIVIDNNLLKANIPSPPSVNDATITITQGGVTKGTFTTNQSTDATIAIDAGPDMSSYYTKSQTDSLLDEKIDNSVVQTPLEYLPDTTQSITLHNMNADYSGIVVDDSYTASNPEVGDVQPYFEINLSNGINIVTTVALEPYLSGYVSGLRGYTKIIKLGYYNEDVFIPVCTVYPRSGYNDSTLYMYTGNKNSYSIGYAASIGGYYQFVSYDNVSGAFALFGCSSTSGSGTRGTKSIVSEEDKLELNKVTTARFTGVVENSSLCVGNIVYYNIAGNGSTVDPNVYNPSKETYPFYSLNNADNDTRALLGTFISDNSKDNLLAGVHPASLSLKYDSTTLGVNANNELTVPTATSNTLGLVKPDGSTITINNGVISAVSSTPSNMVTTNTNQTITGQKKFTDYTTFYSEYGPVITSNMNDVNAGRGIRFSSQSIRLRGNGYSTGIYLSSYGNLGQNAYDFSILQSNNITYFNQDSYISDKRIFRNNTSSNFLLEKDMLDGTTITYDSTTHKISAAGSTPTKKTITQASANVSESSGTVTVTDADVTTSTMVTLYPGDTATETWLANNLASNIITEGSGSFTFTINGTLPATFSMYYIIQEVD